MKSFSGIPAADFIDNVEEFMKRSENKNAESVLKRLDELHQKYKYMEANLAQRKLRLHVQIPDIKKSLLLLDMLTEQKRQEATNNTRFLLSDQCYVTASVPPQERVMLWLGANVMLEYSLDEARQMLTQNLESAEKQLSQIENDLDFLKDQLTTTEVSMARVYNWDVQRRKETAKQATWMNQVD